MWIVQLALRRPVSVAVMAALMLLLGLVSLGRMKFDIFPAINVPVVGEIWDYPGLSAQEMEERVVTPCERGSSSTVNGIEHIESTSLNGIGLLKFYFQPGVDTAMAIAQLNSIASAMKNQMPPGINAPDVFDYDATDVPVLYLMFSSATLPQSRVFDFGFNFARLFLFTIPGETSPAPFGGATRQVMINLDPARLYARGVSPYEVVDALQSQNVIMPGGSAKIGNLEYTVLLNGSPRDVQGLDQLPIKVVNGVPVYMRDVGAVSDSHAVQDDVVRVNGQLGVYMLVEKHAAASTLSVINGVKAALPRMRALAPKGLNIAVAFDQSVFVQRALQDVVQEGLIAAGLVALMVLLFLGSVRSTLIVVTSIPLAIFTSIIGLKLSGETINLMTLGGLALAVGMLVDDATVEVENIHRNHAMGKPLGVAILDGARQIALPTLIGTLAICVVFSPVLGLTGVARFLFTPLALAVVYAMLASYLLSRTLVPSMALHLLPNEHQEHRGRGFFGLLSAGFERGFERMRDRYELLLSKIMGRRGFSLACAGLVVLASLGLMGVVGEDFFPEVDTGMIRLHVRMPVGLRIEESTRVLDQVEADIRRAIPPSELQLMTDHIGLPIFWSLLFYQTDSIGPQDADLQIQLSEHHHPTAAYIDRIRELVHRDHPEVLLYSQAADIVSQVLSFGLSAPVDVQVVGPAIQTNYKLARELATSIATIPGAVDVRIPQVMDYPALMVTVDRAKALELGVTQQDVTYDLLTSLASSAVFSPNQWLDPRTGVEYNVAVQTPPRLIDSIQALGRTPIASTQPLDGTPPQFLANLAEVSHMTVPQVVSHHTVQRVIDVNCNVEGRDLGSVTRAVQRKIDALTDVPPTVRIRILGESAAMHAAFDSMGQGLLLAIVLAYLLMAVNFQSWLDPLIIMMAVPGALAGVLWMLVATHTTINVESLMGAIMAVGVGVANGNLLVTFANDLREQGRDAISAASEAARVRMRPVLMTALAMILGMLPMSLALGAGGEENAPLGRAVIGGLVAATAMTLFVIPTVYSFFTHVRIGKRERDHQVAALVAQAEKD